MTTTASGVAVPKAYLVTVVETYRVEAESEEDAISQVEDLRPSHHADTVDIQVEALA